MKFKFDKQLFKMNMILNSFSQIIKIIFFISILFVTKNVVSQNTSTNQAKQKQNLSYKVIPSIENTYGYEIIQNGKTFIYQVNIPSMPGNKGFKTKEEAKNCALLVIDKIKKNIMPPSVSRYELDSISKINLK